MSIILPVCNPSPDFFISALDSILAQHYPYWELCIADDASTDIRIKAIIDAYVHKDNRIKAVFRSDHGGFSTASNSALALASGELIVLMGQNDLIANHALYHIAVEINRYPDLTLIYSDEDKIDELGTRSEPYFKSDWNPDLFYSQNMFTHLGVYRTSLVNEVGGFRPEYEAAEDYDLTLRCVAHVNANTIRHIPRVLYHSRIHSASTAQTPGNLDYAAASYRALQNHFSGTAVKIETVNAAGLYRVKYPCLLNRLW